MVEQWVAFDKWQELRAEAYEKGKSLEKADKRFEKWLSDQQVEENIKENPSLYRSKDETKSDSKK